jgi:hypothetical protein
MKKIDQIVCVIDGVAFAIMCICAALAFLSQIPMYVAAIATVPPLISHTYMSMKNYKSFSDS